MASTRELQVYKCPNCGGAVTFDADSGRLCCAWCGNAYSEEDLSTKRTAESVQGYLCPECGAQLMTDEFIAADTCPYCGNNEIAAHRYEGAFEPDYVIPFSLTKQRAIDCYEAELTKRKFLPDDFTRESRITSVQGTYVPFWLKNGVVDFDLTFRADVKVNDSSRFSYHHRVGTYDYHRIPADGSAHMPDDMMDSIEPYDYDQLAPFSTSYLPGFVAERYSVSSEDTDARVDRRVANSAVAAAQRTVAYPHKHARPFAGHCRTVGHRHPAEQALLPVWLMVVNYKEGKYLVGVNGQTGKVAVNLPMDEKKRNAAARGQMLREALVASGEILVVFAIFVACFMIAAKTTDPIVAIKKVANVFIDSTGVHPMGIFVVALVVILFGGLVISAARNGFFGSRRKSRKAMQNVEIATNADDFDSNSMHLTVNEEEVGPAVE